MIVYVAVGDVFEEVTQVQGVHKFKGIPGAQRPIVAEAGLHGFKVIRVRLTKHPTLMGDINASAANIFYY